MLLRKRHQHFLCSPVLAATSPYRGDIFVPQSRDGYTKEIIFGHDLGDGLPAKKLSLKCKKPALFRAGQLVRIKP